MTREKNNSITNQNSIREKKIFYKSDRAITLIALIVTTIFSYDENVKFSNNKGFLLQSI